MTCKINADTTNGLKLISDTSGAVDIQSNGTTKVTIDANGNINTVGQVSTTDNGTIVTRQNAKPLIINGDMQVAQRATSLTGYTGPGPFTTVDRYRLDISSLGTHTVAQTASAPDDTGLVNSFRIDCTTADASPGASDFMILSTRLEGQDVQLFKKGTSYAEKITVAFWVKSNKTGTYIVEIDDNDNGRNINQAYTISSANTWEKKVLSFAGDTTGAFGNDNGDSFRLLWWLGAGSNFTSGSLQTAWAATDNTKRAVGQVNIADSTDNDWSITGIQLEVGEYNSTTIPAFQHESFGDNLARCQRYHFTTGDRSGYMFGRGWNNSTTEVFRWGFMLPVEMRAAPTNAISGTVGLWNGAVAGSASLGTSYNTPHAVQIDLGSGGTLNNIPGGIGMMYLNTGRFSATAEL